MCLRLGRRDSDGGFEFLNPASQVDIALGQNLPEDSVANKVAGSVRYRQLGVGQSRFVILSPCMLTGDAREGPRMIWRNLQFRLPISQRLVGITAQLHGACQEVNLRRLWIFLEE